MDYEEMEVIHKSKADSLACILEEKRKTQHKIEFTAKGRYHAVYLDKQKLQEAEEKAKVQGISVVQYYSNKYSVINS